MRFYSSYQIRILEARPNGGAVGVSVLTFSAAVFLSSLILYQPAVSSLNEIEPIGCFDN